MRELQSWCNSRVVQSESERTAVMTRIARIPEFHSVATKAAEFAGGNSLCTSAVSQSSCACLRVKSSRVLYHLSSSLCSPLYFQKAVKKMTRQKIIWKTTRDAVPPGSFKNFQQFKPVGAEDAAGAGFRLQPV